MIKVLSDSKVLSLLICFVETGFAQVGLELSTLLPQLPPDD